MTSSSARAARTWWTAHHLRAALTVTMGSIDEGQVGFVNGYVQLPEGHPDLGGDHRDLDLAVHRGLTYGVDERGWSASAPATSMTTGPTPTSTP